MRLKGRRREGIQLKRRKIRRKREERARAKSVWKSTWTRAFLRPISFDKAETAAIQGDENRLKTTKATAVGSVKKQNAAEEKISVSLPAIIAIEDTTCSFAIKPSRAETVAAQLSSPMTG